MLLNDLYQTRLVIRQRERFLKHYRSNTLAMIGLWLGIILIGLCLLTPILAPYSPMTSITDSLLPPSWYPEKRNTLQYSQSLIRYRLISPLLIDRNYYDCFYGNGRK
jgi:ABC-type antimicrobial peptide transport system permease subunit